MATRAAPSESAAERDCVETARYRDVRVGDEMMLAAGSATVDGAGAGLVAPQKRAQRGGVANGTREVESAGLPKFGEEEFA
jgi:hypothetical protein